MGFSRLAYCSGLPFLSANFFPLSFVILFFFFFPIFFIPFISLYFILSSLCYSSLPIFFISPLYNFSYFSLPLLSLSQSLSFPLSLSFSFLHSFPLLSYFPLSCSITLKKNFLFFPVYYCSIPLPFIFPFPPHLFHFFLCLLKCKKQNIYVQAD